MPSIFSGVRTFLEALRRGADNIIYNLFGLNTPEADIHFQMGRRFPDLPEVPRQMTIDFTRKSSDFGRGINQLQASAVLPYQKSPVSPVLSGNPIYWVDVEWFDPKSGDIGRRLVIMRARPGETKEEFEKRAVEHTEDIWDEYPEFDNRGNRIDPEFRGVVWLRGFQGS